MNILVLGADGQVGWEATRAMQSLGNVIPLSRREADLGDHASLKRAVETYVPRVIVNAAAYTAVDKAETERECAMAINAEAPAILAELAKRHQALLIHYSTDYVFDGLATKAYTETDETNPQGGYGASKRAGEQAVIDSGCDYVILRTSWVYGGRGHNFMRTILRLARERETLRIVADQVGAPTWSRWIADATAHIARQAMALRSKNGFESGLYHMTSAGTTSWHGFASEIIATYRALYPDALLAVQEVVPLTSAEYSTPAKRPANSRLDCSRVATVYGIHQPAWQQSLRLCLQDFQPMAG